MASSMTTFAYRMPSRRREQIGVEWKHLVETRPILTYEQERALLARIVEGRPDDATAEAKADADEARDVLVESNVRFAIDMALGFQNCGVGLDDLVSEGCLGLVEAADRFDFAHTTRYTTYASHHIKKRFHILMAEMVGAARLPLYVWRACGPNYNDKLVVKPEHVEKARRTKFAGSLADLAGGDDDDRLADDRESPWAAMELDQELSRMRKAVSRLDEPMRSVVAMRSGLDGGDGATLKEVAERIGKTREGVRKIELRGLALLREQFAEAV